MCGCFIGPPHCTLYCAMQQWTNWGAAKGLTLHELTLRHRSCAAVQHETYQKRNIRCQAHRRRPTPAQRGASYYENYMRRRREKGGVFLGPPVQLTAVHLQQTHQQQHEPVASVQQQQSNGASRTRQQQQDYQQPSLLEPVPAAAISSSSTTQYDSSTNTATLQFQSVGAAVPASLDPMKFNQLLQECMLATAPSPLGSLRQSNNHNSISQPQQTSGIQQQQQLGPRAQPVQSPTPFQYQQRPRQPQDFKDYVAPELADGLVPELKRRGGLVIEAPVIQHGSPAIPLPELPTATISNSNSSSSRSRTRVLHVYWDISSAHPGGLDPRVIVAHLENVLSSYGQIAGIYAYGLQKMFNWIPEAFMLEYAPERLPGGRNKRIALSHKQQQQQEQMKLQVKAAAASGVDSNEALGPLRCPYCGKLRSNYQQLHLHMVQRHKQPAPPLFKLLPAAALSNAAVAAGNSQSQQQPQHKSTAAASWSPSGVASMMNNSTRTLGRVARYYNSQGALFVPPDSHQIGLKYVLLREGVEVRLVQNHKHAVDVTLAEGLDLLLRQLLQRDAESAQLYEDVVVVMSDRVAHTAVLKSFQKAGFPVLAICRGIKRYIGADLTLRWQWIVNGRYRN